MSDTERITRAGWYENAKVGRLLSEIDPDMYERLVDQIENPEPVITYDRVSDKFTEWPKEEHNEPD